VIELLNKSQWKTPIVAYLVSAGVSVLIAFTSVAINRGFGTRDLLPFLTWTLVFAAVVALVAQILASTHVKMPALLRYCLAGASGVVVGVLWTYVVGQLLGPWLGAFSLPILLCWIAGGASGMILTMLYQENRRHAALISVSVILVLTVSAWTLSKSLGVFISGEQQLELLVLKWHPGTKPLTTTEALEPSISKSDLEYLKAIGLTGEVRFSGSCKDGEGKAARAIIVMQAPLSEPVDLSLPNASQVIYVQTESGWNQYPLEAPTSQKQIRLWTDLRSTSQDTLFSFERADGSRLSGTAATW